MQQMRIFLIIGLTLTIVIYGQTDRLLCPNGPTTIPDPKWQRIPSRFEIVTELISENEMMELSQAFSSCRDTVMTNSKFETSVLQPYTLILKPSILLGFDLRNQVNTLWGNQYIGDEDVRGIPANKFTSCFYVPDIKATVSATYYASDITKLQAYLPQNTSIILQIDVNIRNQAGHNESYKYNVFRYTPNPTREEELQALDTPAGVYCPNRTSTLSVSHNLPDRVSQNSEVFIPQLNSSIVSSDGLYNTEFQFSHFDVWYSDPFGGEYLFTQVIFIKGNYAIY